MKGSSSKELASHTGRALYAGGGNVAGVATAGEHAGQPLSSDIIRFVCRSSALTRRQHHPTALARARWTRRSLRPWHAWKCQAREPRDLVGLRPQAMAMSSEAAAVSERL